MIVQIEVYLPSACTQASSADEKSCNERPWKLTYKKYYLNAEKWLMNNMYCQHLLYPIPSTMNDNSFKSLLVRFLLAFELSTGRRKQLSLKLESIFTILAFIINNKKRGRVLSQMSLNKKATNSLAHKQWKRRSVITLCLRWKRFQLTMIVPDKWWVFCRDMQKHRLSAP